jgi:hypothetical protein
LLVARAGTRRFAVMPQVGENQTALQMRKPKKNQAAIQPEPLTPGITKCMVRKHAEQLCRQRLLDHRPLAFEDWVLAEQDLSKELQK